MYQNGEGVEKNLQAAFKWYHKAAEQRHAKAQNNLASMYVLEEEVEKNLKEAHYWYHKAAEQRTRSSSI